MENAITREEIIGNNSKANHGKTTMIDFGKLTESQGGSLIIHVYNSQVICVFI